MGGSVSATITPKSWVSFQHYKDRKPPWIKLHRDLLDNYEFHCLPLASKALAPCLWLLASEYEGGKIPADWRMIAFRLRMSEAEVWSAVSPLIQSGFFIASEMLAPCKQEARLETEREKEEETEERAKALLSETTSETPKKRKPKKRTAYPEAFEAFWKAYPTDPIMSKKAAFDAWGRLSEEDRDKAGQAVSAFAKHCQANPDYRPVHAVRFLSQRRFDGFAGDSAAPQFMSDTEFQKWWKERHRSPVQ